MKLSPECRDCLQSKIVSLAKRISGDDNIVQKVRDTCMQIYDARANEQVSSTVITGAVHRKCYEIIGSSNPYAEIKKRDNLIATKVVSDIRPMLRNIHDYILAAVIGNAMDYGIFGHTVAHDFTQYFKDMFVRDLAFDDTEKIIQHAKRVVYFTDNCGEVIFDKLLCEELRRNGSHVTMVVKDQPMHNDVTLADAKLIHLDNSVDALYHAGGGAQLGLHPNLFPAEVTKAIEDATLIISKGQANYESLTEYTYKIPIAYLLTVKCSAIAKDVGAKKGDLIAICT